MKSEKQLLYKEYQRLAKLFGIDSRLWAELYTNFSWYVFCVKNRKYIIMQYLMWEDFAERAKKVNFIYYFAIDEFLKEYKQPVYRCLNTGDKEFTCGK